MSQVVLAKRLGVSRTPLREALRMLQSEGLVDSEPNRRVRVSETSPEDEDEVVAMIIPLHCAALRLSMPRMTPEDLAGLEGLVAEMEHFERTGDYGRWSVPHHAFHRGLTAKGGRRFGDLIDQLHVHAERYQRQAWVKAPAHAAAPPHHRDLLEVCKAGDADSAAALLALHLAHPPLDQLKRASPDFEPVKINRTLDGIRAMYGDPELT